MSILHEIGHAVLGHKETGGDIAEAEANFFAKYAAAPPPLVHTIQPQGPEDIYHIFNISYEAACYAYNYYLKWLHYGGEFYTSYENQIIEQFNNSN